MIILYRGPFTDASYQLLIPAENRKKDYQTVKNPPKLAK
jgi:hypothetical protein